MVYKYLGWGITNENGVAKLDHDAQGQEIEHSYTGTGAGEIDVLASLDNPIVEGSIVSETYPVLDCMFYDTALDNSQASHYYNDSGLQISYDSTNGTTASATTYGGVRRYWVIMGESYVTGRYWRDANTNYHIECDVSYENLTGNTAFVFGGVTVHLGGLNSNQQSGTGTVKLVTNGNLIKCYWNGEYVSSMDKTMPNIDEPSGNWGFNFQLYKTANLTFKNIKIYPI